MAHSTLKHTICGIVAGLGMLGSTAMAADQAKYVFFFIGDGMAAAQRHAAEVFLSDKGDDASRTSAEKLVMNRLPAQGMSTVYCLNSWIPDSAATGTALATGQKTTSGVIAMDTTGSVKYQSVAKEAHARDMKVGIISSVSIDHATPAVFYANTPSRKNYYEIARQLADSGFDYFAGGGFLQPTGKKGDQKNIYEILTEKGFRVTRDRAAFEALKPGDGPVVAVSPVVDADEALPYSLDRGEAKRGIELDEFVKKGIDLLNGPEGFFMMVEGGKIDWACHANDGRTSIEDTLALDKAVGVALAFAEKHPHETLIIVTADHETGGMSVGWAGTEYTANFSLLNNQKMSYLEFDKVIASWRNQKVSFDDAMKYVADHYGISAAEGTPDLLKLADYEVEDLKTAYAMSMTPEDQRPSGKKDRRFYLTYGGYEPFSMAVTHALAHHAGLGWTTYAHTGVPVPVSASGVGAQAFDGYYDDTAIPVKIKAAMGM